MECMSIGMTEHALRRVRTRARQQAEKEILVDNESRDQLPSNNTHSRLRSQIVALEISGGVFPEHSYEHEIRRRKNALFFYLLRGPLFDRATLPLLKSLVTSMRGIPVLKQIPVYLVEILTYLNRIHFYNSNS